MAEENRVSMSLGMLMDVDKLQGPNNYARWKQDMRTLLVLEDLWTYIETKATRPRPPATLEELDHWTHAQTYVLTMLKIRCEDEPRALIEHLETAAQAWEKLKTYKRRDWGFLYSTFSRFESLTLSGCNNDPEVYANRFWVCLDILEGLSTESQISENWMIYCFHKGLLPAYSTYVEIYDQTHDAFTEDGKPKFTLAEAIDRFRDFVTYQSVTTSSSAHRPMPVPAEYTSRDIIALVASGKSEARIQKGAHPGNSRVIIQAVKYCTHCKTDYHDIDSCKVLHPELRKRPGNDDKNRGRRRRGRPR